jgi:hypothetical protein
VEEAESRAKTFQIVREILSVARGRLQTNQDLLGRTPQPFSLLAEYRKSRSRIHKLRWLDDWIFIASLHTEAACVTADIKTNDILKG